MDTQGSISHSLPSPLGKAPLRTPHIFFFFFFFTFFLSDGPSLISSVRFCLSTSIWNQDREKSWFNLPYKCWCCIEVYPAHFHFFPLFYSINLILKASITFPSFPCQHLLHLDLIQSLLSSLSINQIFSGHLLMFQWLKGNSSSLSHQKIVSFSTQFPKLKI